jgi:hypothetical protein
MPYLFRTPTRMPTGGARFPVEPNPRTEYDDGPRGAGSLLMRHVSKPLFPVAVLIYGSMVTEVQVPTVTQTREADYHYLGGRDYLITATEAELLTQAGYDVPGYDSPTYGVGIYGTGPYGV